jgi:N-acetylmuramoyl-L-alanine amidase
MKNKNLYLLFFAIYILLFTMLTIFNKPIVYTTFNYETPKPIFNIILDAGHGGIDGGVVSYSKSNKESEVNLLFTECLKSYFNSVNYNVILTRIGNDGLYDKNAKNKKINDMEKRIAIINNSKANLLISIHMNGFTNSNERGSFIYYKAGNEISKNLAQNIQTRFNSSLEYSYRSIQPGDFYILNNSIIPAILVEFGFLTNKDEEILLLSKEYREKMCFLLFSSVVSFL